MQKKKSVLLILVLLLICLFVSGCKWNITLWRKETYTVKFMAGKELLWKEELLEGQFPTEQTPEIAGYTFYGWRDEDGLLTQPEAVAVTENQTYYADIYPDLSNHVPYLLTDSGRFLHPDDALTNEDLSVALNLLATEDAKAHLPKLPEGADAVTSTQLTQLLNKLLPKERVSAVMEVLDSETITRSRFASIINTLLDRCVTTAELSENTQLPYDLSVKHRDFTNLAEATLAHTHTDDSKTWENQIAERKNSEGFFNVDGWLYHVDANGELTKDASIGTLIFGADGRFTSTDSELDELVSGILAEIINNNPGAERIDLLRRAFEYSRDSFSYLRRSAYAFGQTGWEIEDAKKMFTTKRGNCYNYAATFWALARGLGYDAVAISGTMTKTYQPHSWVEIMFDGEYFVFDSEMEMVYRFERNIFDKDMFMVSYEKGKYWTYVRP